MTDTDRLERETRKQQVEELLRQLEVTAQLLAAYYQTLGTDD